MIKLPNLPLPKKAASTLAHYQREVDRAGGYAARVARAKELFSKRNSEVNATFRVVRRILRMMCSGTQRCGYCEDSLADEVEHFCPKVLYPERVFEWSNLLYACGPCNGPKNNQFAVFPPRSSSPRIVTRHRGAPIIPPVAGNPVLIDPRKENALDFVTIDLLSTFQCIPRSNLTPRDRARATYTIDVLNLNRSPLPEARGQQYRSFCALLFQYAHTTDVRRKRELAHSIQRGNHPAVWQEMKRRRSKILELSELFRSAPEALTW